MSCVSVSVPQSILLWCSGSVMLGVTDVVLHPRGSEGETYLSEDLLQWLIFELKFNVQ